MIETFTRKSKFTELKPYCHFTTDDTDFMELCEWNNGEGFDLIMALGKRLQTFSMTWGQFEALQALAAYRE